MNLDTAECTTDAFYSTTNIITLIGVDVLSEEGAYQLRIEGDRGLLAECTLPLFDKSGDCVPGSHNLDWGDGGELELILSEEDPEELRLTLQFEEVWARTQVVTPVYSDGVCAPRTGTAKADLSAGESLNTR